MTQNFRKRVAFDFTVFFPPVFKGDLMISIMYRDGGDRLIERLKKDFDLLLWTTESPDSVEQLPESERKHFSEVHFWKDNAFHWKDVRAINADFLIDENPHHLETAMTVNISERYVLVEPFGSAEDIKEPYRWAKIIEKALYND